MSFKGNNPLGQIKKVNVRDVFKDEARDFTPWLAQPENLALLSEEIGVEIKLLEVEANVGRFNVDILALADGTDRKIIIENQFNYTDHDHLGKLITYASGHDAKVIIWIFEEIRNEHRQAIEWLNENTNENLDFFVISIQLWRIDESNPAPKFEIIVSPNEWTKTIRSRTSTELSDTKLQQLEFWTQLKAYSSEKQKGIKLQSPRPQHWYSIAVGSSDAHISLTINTQEGRLGCELYIINDKNLFQFLQSKSSEIEQRIGAKLEWIEAAKAARVKTVRNDFVITDRTRYAEHFEWLVTKTIAFQKTFSDLIKTFYQTR